MIQKVKRESVYVAVFGALFVFSLIMILSQSSQITGHATETSTFSNVTISVYFAIDMSTNLTEGIQFGDVTALPSTNVNATHNYDGANTTVPSPGTSMWMNVSSDSNSAVDFCLKADALNTSTSDVIGLGNESYANNTDTSSSLPALGSEIGLTTSFVSAGTNVAAGNNNYYRFWLDVPAGTASGTYNNTVSFKGVATGGSC